MRLIRRSSSFARLSLAVAAAVALAACTDASSDNGGLPTDAGQGLYPSISVSSSHGIAQVDLALRQVPGGLRFASYQGELTFDPQLLTLQSADLPEGVDGAANQSAPGHVRFSGAALDGTVGAPMLHLRFAARGALTRESFTVTFEEVTRDGDFEDLTAQVKTGALLYQSH
ncbi:MAG TPA: hypothetical protein VGO40_13820 [Longimicrobium sp.]|jgi:hypothetical protein|nr:hypothetical protein [Longimicrobium sp.]